jgi:NADH-quinone oxidoreductase subunit E
MAVRRLALDQPIEFAFTPENRAWCETQIAKYPPGRQASAVLPLLWRAQVQHDNWLPRPAIELVAKMLDMPDIRVLEVATFYSMFNLAPVGTFFIQLCGTTPCLLRGADAIRAVLERRIGAPLEVTPDNKFSWLEVECLGACCNAPMVQINADYYEDLSPDTMNQLMDDLAAGKPVKRGSQTGRVTSEFAPGKATTLQDPALYDGSMIGAWRARFEDLAASSAATAAARSTPVAPPPAPPAAAPTGHSLGEPPAAVRIAPVPTPVPTPTATPAETSGGGTSAAAAGPPLPGSAPAPGQPTPAASRGAAIPDTAASTAPAAKAADAGEAKTSPPPRGAAQTTTTSGREAPKAAVAGGKVAADDAGKVAPGGAPAPSASVGSQAPVAAADEAAGGARPSAAEIAAREETEIQAKLAVLSKNASAEEKARAVGTRPVGLAEARSGSADDLKRIKGVGKVNEGKLNALGIYHFDQIGAWTRPEIQWVDTYLSFPGRIDREDWVTQARLLAAGGETEFSQRVERAEGPISPDAPSRPKKG